MWPPGFTLAMTLTWIFKVKYGICYISAKNGLIATKQKANISIEPYTPQMWPSDLTLAMTLTLNILKVKYGICYISAKNGPIATKQKVDISIELKASNVTTGFGLGHDLDPEVSR